MTTPKKVTWEEDYDGGEYPMCPNCGELAYFYDKCCFCGQVFDQDDEKLKAFCNPVEVEKDGYIICQASNHHIHIYNSYGQMVYHASCTKAMTAEELEKHLDFFISYKKGAKREWRKSNG